MKGATEIRRGSRSWVLIGVGFLKQPNLWQCGPYALKHALIMLGAPVDEKHVSELAGTGPSGTDEKQLARAARKLGCQMRTIRRCDADGARRALVRYLRRGVPCLLCVHDWRHWVVVVKEERGRFILLDSEDAGVLTIPTWDELRRIWVYHRGTGGTRSGCETVYDVHPLAPRFRVRLRARFSVPRARFLRRPENRELAQQWDQYLEDLLVLCRPAAAPGSNVVSLGRFLRWHGEMIVDQVAFWHGAIGRPAAEKVLRNLRFVANTHGLVIPLGSEKKAIAGLTALLSLWAGGKYGVRPVYQNPRRTRRRARGRR